jgi:hypothetical protein
MHFKWVWRELRGKALAGVRKLLSGCKFIFIIVVLGLFVARFVWYKYIEISAACFFLKLHCRHFSLKLIFCEVHPDMVFSSVILRNLNK